MDKKETKKTFEVRDLRQRNKFVVDDLALNGYARFIGIYATGVYVCLCRHANREQSAWPSINRIAEKLHISVPMVDGAIWTLELFNMIRKQRLGKMLCNRYWLLDKKEWIPLTPEDVNKFLSDLNSIKISELNNVKITIKRRLNHDLTVFKSSSKETHSKETHSKEEQKKPVAPADNPINKINLTTLEKIRTHYIDKKGWKEETLRRDDFARIHKAIKVLYIKAEENTDSICQAIEWVSRQGYCDWTLETVAKKWPDFIKQQEDTRARLKQAREFNDSVRQTKEKAEETALFSSEELEELLRPLKQKLGIKSH